MTEHFLGNNIRQTATATAVLTTHPLINSFCANLGIDCKIAIFKQIFMCGIIGIHSCVAVSIVDLGREKESTLGYWA